MMNRLLSTIAVLLLVCCVPCCASAQAYTAAGCALKVGDSLLLVQGGPAKNWSLPAGYIEPGEVPEDAARRETYEETGLHVRVRQPITIIRQAGFRLFACEVERPLEVSAQRINVLGAPHLGRESIQAGLFNRSQAQRIPLRFPEQVSQLMSHLAYVPDSAAERVPDFSLHASPLHAFELPMIQGFIDRLPGWGAFFRVGNFFGETWFYVLCLPLLAWRLGWRYLYRMAMGLVLLAIVVETGKLMLAMPRPFHLAPGLSERVARGFGMPSGHSFGAMYFFGALALWVRGRLPVGIGLPLAAILALWTGLARVWIGVHFFSDVLVGFLLAGLLLCLERLQHRWEERSGGRQWGATPWVWLLLSLIGLTSSLAWMQESLFLPFALSLGFAMGGRRMPQEERATTGQALYLLVGSVALAGFNDVLLKLLQVFWQQAVVMGLTYTLLGWWLRSGAYTSYRLLLARGSGASSLG